MDVFRDLETKENNISAVSVKILFVKWFIIAFSHGI